MGYFSDLEETFEDNPKDILSTGFLIWVIFPIILFGIWGIFEAVFKYKNFNVEIFSNLLVNAIIPWWLSIIMNLSNFLLEIIFCIIISLILIHHEVIEPISPKELISYLKRN
jgi:hypothetical protein